MDGGTGGQVRQLVGAPAEVGGAGQPEVVVDLTAVRADGSKREFQAIARIDSNVEVGYYKNGGILQSVLRRLMVN